MIRRLATAVALSLVAALVVAPGTARAVTPPGQAPFYTAPGNLAAYTNGAVLRQRSVTVNVVGIPFPVRSWQLMYRSTDAHGTPAADVTTVMVPLIPYLGVRPLLSYQTAEDSLGSSCAPSYSLRGGLDNIVGTAEMALIAGALTNGWAVTVPGYEGLQSEYGAGAQAGHAPSCSTASSTQSQSVAAKVMLDAGSMAESAASDWAKSSASRAASRIARSSVG